MPTVLFHGHPKDLQAQMLVPWLWGQGICDYEMSCHGNPEQVWVWPGRLKVRDGGKNAVTSEGVLAPSLP